jgi:hypothetical protein
MSRFVSQLAQKLRQAGQENDAEDSINRATNILLLVNNTNVAGYMPICQHLILTGD